MICLALFLLQAPLLDLLPPEAAAVAVCEHPDAMLEALLEGELGSRVRAGGLWAAVQAQPAFAPAMLGWAALSMPVAGQPAEFARALAGGGFAVALMPGIAPGATPGAAPAPPAFVFVARFGDAELAAEILEQAARLAKVPVASVQGEQWDLPLGAARLARRGDLLLFASTPALAEALTARVSAGAATAAHPAGLDAVRDRSAARKDMAGIWAWARGDLLRVNGYAALPADLGASLLLGDLHEAVRVAPWAGASLQVNRHRLLAEFIVPEPAALATTHAPFRAPARPVALPRLEGTVLRGVLLRNLGGWYNARDLYASEAAVAGSVEGDGNFRVLFGRDFGPDVLAWLEPELRLVAARNPDAAGRPLELELPAAALGLQLRDGAPADLGRAFTNAFMAAITFINFQSGVADEKYLGLDLETLPDGGKLYFGRRPPLGSGVAAPLSHNAEPAMYLGAKGEIWLSSSIGLLKQILAAPADPVRSASSWAELSLPPLADLVARARGAIVAQRLLKNGGDLEAAQHFAALIESAARLADGGALRFGPADGYCSVTVELHAQPE